MERYIRRSGERGHTRAGWLDSRHTFSFGGYADREHMGYGALRVLNDDWVEPAQGFAEHGHRDAEIFTYVLEGQLEHKDSMGYGRVLKAGDIQYMSAGQGVRHSEFNPSATERAHFLQVWLIPDERGGEPRYEDRELSEASVTQPLTLLLSGKETAGAIFMRTSGEVYLARMGRGRTIEHALDRGRALFLHVIQGRADLEGEILHPGDGMGIHGAERVRLRAEEEFEGLLFDLPE